MDRIHRFIDKVAIITGSASGIGLATARLISSESGVVVLADISENRLKEAKAGFPVDRQAKVETFVCDVSKQDQVRACVAQTLERFGRLDVIINNAGLMVFKSFEDHTEEDWSKVLGVDLLGAFFFLQEAFKHMKPGGTVVNVSSIHAVETTPSVTSYAAAKAALLSLTRSAALEGKAKGLRVNSVLPGAIDTPMLWENPNIKSGLEVIQQSDVGSAEEIAAAIAFLASDESKFTQGTSLRVDCGRLARL